MRPSGHQVLTGLSIIKWLLFLPFHRSTDLETIESFELYGHRHTDKELIRHIYGILDQLLPTLKRDLYEDVDGVKVTDSHVINPQSSPLLPGAVKMHREANTTDPDSVLIKNHFDRADFLNMPSDIDLDLKYSDFASINKSNGMVTESHAYVSEQLNFGEDIHFKGGVDASMMKITLTSHVSLLETDTFYLGYAESQAVKYQFFVKLVVPKSDPTFSVKEQPHKPPGASKNSEISPNTSLPVHNTTNSSTTALRRSRRASNTIQRIWEDADPIYLRVDHSVTLFEQRVIGINVKGEGTAWIEGSSGIEIGIAFDLFIGGEKVRLFSKTYKAYELEDGQGIQTGFDYGTGLVSLFSHDNQYSTKKYIDFRDYDIQRGKQERAEGKLTLITQRRPHYPFYVLESTTQFLCVYGYVSSVPLDSCFKV